MNAITKEKAGTECIKIMMKVLMRVMNSLRFQFTKGWISKCGID